VEVGTHHGRYARTLLEGWPGRLICVDPWAVPPGYEGQVKFLAGLGDDTGGNREEDLRIALRNLSPFETRARILRHTSENAAPLFGDGTLDFVYLDGDHRSQMVSMDLQLWWPKVKPGGLLALHDFVSPGRPAPGNWGPEIQAALIPFAWDHNLYIYMIVERDNNPWTAYVFKPRE
jgi:hypothetical protein